MVCRRGINDAARWQFCKKIHRPLRLRDRVMSSSALGPWPWPSETISMWRVLPRVSFANRNSCWVGSEPGERMNTIGVWAWLWLYNSARVGTPEARNFGPSVCTMKWCIAKMSASGRSSFMIIRRWNLLNLPKLKFFQFSFLIKQHLNDWFLIFVFYLLIPSFIINMYGSLSERKLTQSVSKLLRILLKNDGNFSGMSSSSSNNWRRIFSSSNSRSLTRSSWLV